MAKPKKIYLTEAVVIGAGADAQTLEPGKVHSIEGDVANGLIKSGAARLPNQYAEAVAVVKPEADSEVPAV